MGTVFWLKFIFISTFEDFALFSFLIPVLLMQIPMLFWFSLFFLCYFWLFSQTLRSSFSPGVMNFHINVPYCGFFLWSGHRVGYFNWGAHTVQLWEIFHMCLQNAYKVDSEGLLLSFKFFIYSFQFFISCFLKLYRYFLQLYLQSLLLNFYFKLYFILYNLF